MATPFIVALIGAHDCPRGTVPWPELKSCQPITEATSAETEWLRKNIFAFDKPNEATLFEDGIAVPTVRLALLARQKYGWAATVPRDVFRASVLPFASVNEARTDWRQLFWDTLSPALAKQANSSSLEEVATLVNGVLWAALGQLTGRKAVVFRSEQTPLIFDPISTVLFGYASCTGISLTYVDALRMAGVPARLVGTPAWHGKPSDGNHNWVEVWLGSKHGWAFIEGAPAGGGETFANPCDKWFCNKAHFNTSSPSGTRVFAATFGGTPAPHYPMAWDLSNADVPGEDRSSYYLTKCGTC